MRVAAVVDRQEAAVLGVEDEEQATEEDERRVAHLVERRRGRRRGDGFGERGEDEAEDQLRQVARDPFFIERPWSSAIR